MALEALASYMKKARTKAKLSQRMVAKELGWNSAQFVSNVERGLCYPPIKVIPHWAELIGVEPDEIYSRVMGYIIERSDAAYNEAAEAFKDKQKRKKKTA